MDDAELQKLFPSMTPIKRAPSMFRVNGCGVSVYGNRDFHEHTGTFITTWCVAILFVPIFALRAYRVAQGANGGYYFLGREPLSALAKWWNRGLIAAILLTIFGFQYHAYTTSPGYVAKKQMASAAKLADEGRLTDAARGYQALATRENPENANAAAALKALIDGPCQSAALGESAGVFAAAAQVARRTNFIPAADVSDKGLKLVAARGDVDPRAGVALLDAIRQLVIDTRPIDDRRFVLLQKWAAAEPTNLDVLVPLASVHEQRGQLDDAAKLLTPVKDKLGHGEGARVLGMVLSQRGDYDAAYALLWPYTKGRLAKLHDVEAHFNNTLKRIWDREVNLLRQDKGPRDLYAKLKDASDDQQQALVQEYVNGKIRQDPAYATAQQDLEREAAVVPVALELGTVMLHRAQGLPESTRKPMLQSAEEVFLAIGGIAGESDVYRVSLGQVYYWLGKQDEGRKLFDEYLAAKNHDPNDMVRIAAKLRMVGAEPEARDLAEKAYAKATKNEQRHEAAMMRALCQKDLDDQIAWLNKSNTADPYIKASLAKASGDKAIEEGRLDDAAKHYNTTIAAYGAMPRDATTLNETALAYYGLFFATGDRSAFDKCADYFQQAVDLSPSDAILLNNAAVTILDGALADVIGTELDLRALRRGGDFSLLSHLYSDTASRAKVIERVNAHPGVTRALAYFDKVMVLAPKNASAYRRAYAVHSFTRDEAALRSLEQRARNGGIDDTDQIDAAKERLSGAKDAHYTVTMTAAVKQSRDVLAKVRQQGGRTVAAALDDVVERLLALDAIAGNVDVEEVVKLADEAHQLAPSAHTAYTRLAAHLYRAHKDLCADKSYDALAKQRVRSLGVTHLLAAVLIEPGPIQQRAIAHPRVQAAVQMLRDQNRAFPDSPSPYEWAMLKNLDAAEAAKLADGIRTSTRLPVLQSLEKLLNPTSGTEAVETYWMFLAQDKPAEARAVLADYARLGLPSPLGR